MTTTKTTILYIDDDPVSRMLVNRTLRYAGYHVVVAERGLEGIDIVRSEPIDLILTDLDLPDVSGRELTTMLRSDKRFAQVPIVVLTAADVIEQRELAMAAGITGYLIKPLDVEALPDQLEYYLRGGKDKIDNDRLSSAQTRYAHEVVSHLETRIRELEEKNKDLLRLDKIKDTFIQITAHELRTPLTLVYGYSRLLQESPKIQTVLETDENAETLIDGLVEAIERMQSIVNEILTISRIMTNQIDLSIGPINVVNLIQQSIKQYKNAIEMRNLNLDIHANTFPNTIRADSDMIKLVMDNLISNAIKYTPDGGNITIQAKTDDDFVYISFIDSGIGIPEEDIDLIFDRFHTANDPQLHTTSKTAFFGGGLGLGLAICRGIIDAHGGTIKAYSKLRDRDNPPGSEFRIVLPRIARVKPRKQIMKS